MPDDNDTPVDPQRAAAVAELDAILSAFPEGQARAYPGTWRETGTFEYLYRRGTLVVRREDAAFVQQAVTEVLLEGAGPVRMETRAREGSAADRRPGDSLVHGVTRLLYEDGDRVENDVPAVLDRLDALIGAGAGRPEAVFHAAGHACSATDPALPPAGAPRRPYPGRACDPADCADDLGVLGAGVRVGIVDTGLVSPLTNLPWMAGVTGDPDPQIGGAVGPYTGHGTFVAGCVRAMAPSAQIRVERGLLHGGAMYELDLAAQIQQALAASPDVLIVSFVAETRNELTALGLDVVYEQQLRQRKNLQVLGPAGNGGSNVLQYPSGYDWVLAVGGLDWDWRTLAPWSNRGNWVDVYAPGADVINAFATGPSTASPPIQFTGLARWSGTCFATGLVGGLIAARMSAAGESAPVATQALLAAARLPVGGARPRLTPDQTCSVVLH